MSVLFGLGGGLAVVVAAGVILLVFVVLARPAATRMVETPAPPPPRPPPITPELVYALCQQVARLHAEGRAHGALVPSQVLPVLARDRGVVPTLPAPVDAAGGEDRPRPAREGAAVDDGPYRTASAEPVEASLEDDDGFVAPEARAGGPPDARADVYALGGWLEVSLRWPPHWLPAPAWAAVVATARSDDPRARQADAGLLARAMIRAALATEPGEPFAGLTFAPCPACGERLLGWEPPQVTMFDGRGADGRAVGGSTKDFHGRCAGCGHREHRTEREAYGGSEPGL